MNWTTALKNWAFAKTEQFVLMLKSFTSKNYKNSSENFQFCPFKILGVLVLQDIQGKIALNL